MTPIERPTDSRMNLGVREIIESVRTAAAPITRALALELIDVECTGQGPRTLVRVFIDKPGGVTVADCERVHVSLGHALDIQDPIPHAYILEVSSPGLDRPLKAEEDYRRAIGKLVHLKLRRPFEGQWRLIGRLLDVQNDRLSLLVDRPAPARTISLERTVIADARLEVEW
jgi:ribosome maturation factor RimP